jgi:hypothetical protein
MKFTCQLCILIIALAPLPGWATDAQPSTRLADGGNAPAASPREALEAFRQQHRALIADVPQAWRVRFAPRDAISVSTTDALQALSDDLLGWLDALPADHPEAARLTTSWTSIFKDVFTLRIMLEWQSFEPAWQQFGLLQSNLAEMSSQLGRGHVAKTTAALADPILRLWLNEHHETLLPWISEFESGWSTDSQGKLPSWWLKDRSAYAMSLTGQESTSEIGKLGERWMLDYLGDASVLPDRRTSLASRYALQMHSLGHPERAGAILAWWEQQHPEATANDVRFLHMKFFVHQIGHGNREAARQILERLDALIESGALRPDDDRFRVVTQNYYRNLRHSDLDHAMLTSQLVEARNSSTTE